MCGRYRGIEEFFFFRERKFSEKNKEIKKKGSGLLWQKGRYIFSYRIEEGDLFFYHRMAVTSIFWCRMKSGRGIIKWKMEGIRGGHLERDQQACWKYHRLLFEQRSVHVFGTWEVVVWGDLKRGFWEHEMGCLKGSKERALRAWEWAVVLDLCKEFFRGKDAIFLKGSGWNFSKWKGVTKKEGKGETDYCCC